MEYLILALAIIAICSIIYKSIKRKQDSNASPQEQPTGDTTDNRLMEHNNKTSNNYSGMKPRELCMTLLNDLNCKTIEDEENKERIEFKFQGETFCLIVSDDCLLVTVYDFSWGSVSLDDLDEVSRLRKVINNVNFRFGGLCCIYTMDTDQNRMVVHTKRQFLMTPEIPNITDYMEAMLTGFFEVQRALTHELDRLRMGEKED